MENSYFINRTNHLLEVCQVGKDVRIKSVGSEKKEITDEFMDGLPDSLRASNSSDFKFTSLYLDDFEPFLEQFDKWVNEHPVIALYLSERLSPSFSDCQFSKSENPENDENWFHNIAEASLYQYKTNNSDKRIERLLDASFGQAELYTIDWGSLSIELYSYNYKENHNPHIVEKLLFYRGQLDFRSIFTVSYQDLKFERIEGLDSFVKKIKEDGAKARKSSDLEDLRYWSSQTIKSQK
jgi:hypothetical protein